jgi:hypothetical protein
MDSPFHDPGSFRDPAGQVWLKDGWVYRVIFAPGVSDYEAAHGQGIFHDLIREGLLLPHEEFDKPPEVPPQTVYCLRHPKLPLITYPWEWSFSMLQDAGLLLLEIMENLVPKGFWLRDASALNVQFDGNRLRLIDTLSIGRRPSNSPWVAYHQFCSHFMAPLALAACGDVRTLGLWREFFDGYPLDLAARLLPINKKYRPGLFFHLVLHAWFSRKYENREGPTDRSARWSRVSDPSLLGLVRSLKRTVSRIRSPNKPEFWKEYQAFRLYRDADVQRKKEYVEKAIREIQPGTVWDLGGNVGEFSRVAAASGAFVASIDSDPSCTEYLYRSLKKEGQARNLLPLTMNLANPSPGLGWDNRERASWRDRGPADLVMALIHHLVFSAQIPLPLVAEWMSRISRFILAEFVPPSDPMVQKLQKSSTLPHPYSYELFQESFGRFFDFIDQVRLENERLLFLGRKK